ncbi:hypothetical protein AYK86_11860 [Acinetobacter venetianus]|uniref:hypothetical protein n=1 Tax=Acinetobacter venetianus TaxID=52133 RepID=UPI000775ACC0|nr:hypothetical protein [Acinetobacter venetianus]KXO86816.1 hypothetical protein AYK86_11860 [Acinetobacter venetianus]
MENLVVNIQDASITKEDLSDLASLLDSTEGTELISINASNSFNGMEDVIIILSIGGGVAIKQLGAIFIAWINKNKNKKIKYKNFEASGYSSDEFIKIVKELEGE